MAWEIPILDIPETAGADLSASQFRFVQAAATGVTVNSTAGSVSIGVLQNTPGSGHAASVRVAGVTKIVAGASISRNDELTTNTSGAAVVATTGQKIHGVALEAGAAGEIITMLIRPNGTAA